MPIEAKKNEKTAIFLCYLGTDENFFCIDPGRPGNHSVGYVIPSADHVTFRFFRSHRLLFSFNFNILRTKREEGMLFCE